MYNPDQKDYDLNGHDTLVDLGSDSSPDAYDNSRYVFNEDQTDLDGEDLGSVCYGLGDCDRDSYVDPYDNWPTHSTVSSELRQRRRRS